MKFVETPVFTKALRASLSDEEYRSLQTVLLLRPEQGALVRGTGGLRKMRWAGLGHGKRGGYRIIYYYDSATESFYCCTFIPKTRRRISRLHKNGSWPDLYERSSSEG